ncbi:MAG: FliH/SctL family protein [Myxococcota bacterium]|nr:FliH/SctL family protein [Myxococcota bacterium]
MSQAPWFSQKAPQPQGAAVHPATWATPAAPTAVRPLFAKPIPEDAPINPGLDADTSPKKSLPPAAPPGGDNEPAVLTSPPPAPSDLSGEFDHQLALLSAALAEVADAQHRETQQRAAEALELGLVIAEELAAGAIQIEPQRALALIEEAFQLMGEAREVKIRLQPDLFDSLESAGLLDELKAADQVALLRDPDVQDMGCIVASHAGRVDARVRARLNRLRHELQREQGG